MESRDNNLDNKADRNRITVQFYKDLPKGPLGRTKTVF